MVGCTQHHNRASFGERDNKAGRPGYAVRMNDYRLNIVECNPAQFLTIKTDDKKAAIGGQVQMIRDDINDAAMASLPRVKAGTSWIMTG